MRLLPGLPATSDSTSAAQQPYSFADEVAPSFSHSQSRATSPCSNVSRVAVAAAASAASLASSLPLTAIRTLALSAGVASPLEGGVFLLFLIAVSPAVVTAR